MSEPKPNLLEHLPKSIGGQRLRLSQDSPQSALAGSSLLVSPDAPHAYWRDWELDRNWLDYLSAADLLDLLTDLSPDVSKALWDFLRFMNPGWEVKCYRQNGKTPDKQAQTVVDSFFDTLKGLYGSVDVILGRANFTAFLRGGYFFELILDRAGRTPLDVATPDPRWLHFEKQRDEDRGEVFRPFQWQNGKKVYLERDTIRYLPVDPAPGKPHGRPLAHPSLFTTLFTLGLLHDLRRVISQQGYPRLDLSIDLDVLLKIMPAEYRTDPGAMAVWLDETVSQIRTTYEALEPDDAYIHASHITVNRPVGTVDSDSLGEVKEVIALLERQAVRALKTMPLLMAIPEGMSEANANRQYEVFAAGIKSLQHLHESAWEHMLSLVLQAQGRQARVEVRFAELRAAEMLRDAQTEALKIKNAAAKYQAGWLSQQEACSEVTGKETPDQEEPRGPVQDASDTGTQNPEEVQAEPGSNRSVREQGRGIVPKGAGAALDEIPAADALAGEAEESAGGSIALWDAALGDFSGLLDAEVVA
jgi:hypothetical protein